MAGKVNENEEPVPEVAIRGIGYVMCFDYSKKMFIKIARGIKAYIVEPKMNAFGRITIYTFTGEVVEIEPDELINTGFD